MNPNDNEGKDAFTTRLLRYVASFFRRPVHERQRRRSRERMILEQSARIKAEIVADLPDATERKRRVILPSPIKTDAERDAPVRCPHCVSTQLSANAEGFKADAAAAGMVLLGPIGLALGGSGKVKITCLRCGVAFAPGSQLGSD